MHRKILLSLLAISAYLQVRSTAFEMETMDASPKVTQQPIDPPQEYNGKEIFDAEAWEDEVLIENHLDFEKADVENTSEHQNLQSSRHLQVDRLCSPSNTVDNVCTISNMTLRFSTDLKYETEKSLVFDNTKIKCLTITYAPCSFEFVIRSSEASKFELKNGSRITGKQIIVAAPRSELKISNDSSLWASGQSIMTQGTQTHGVGAAYVGQAGYCGGVEGWKNDEQRTYGYFSRLPNTKDLTNFDFEIGSIGKPNDVETAGGGRILVYADSITLQGEGAKIQANARPFHDQADRRYSLQGGSGGYIYVRTGENYKKNFVEKAAKIEAKGGYSLGDYTAGSGGMVVLDSLQIEFNNIVVHGGLSHNKNKSGCANGAAGSLYIMDTDMLVIDNNNYPVAAATTVQIPKARQHNSSKGLSELAKSLLVRGQANLIIKGEHFGLTFNELRVEDDSVIEFGQQNDAVYIRFLHTMNIFKNAILDFHKTSKVFIHQSDDTNGMVSTTTLGRMFFKEFLAVRGKNVNLIGDVRVPTSFNDREKVMSNFIVEAENLKVHQNVNLESGFHFLYANNTLELEKGSKLLSLRNHMCNLHANARDMYTCMHERALPAERLDLEEMIMRYNKQYPGSQAGGDAHTLENLWDTLRTNYSSYLVSLGELKTLGAHIEGPRVGICASHAQIKDTLIHTSGHGCPSDYGFGKGQKYASCAGSGGANGGKGGYGGLDHSNKDYKEICQGQYAMAYSSGLQPNYEGSGGASGIPGDKMGGSGGGIVRIAVLNELRMSRSKILANGFAGRELGGFGSGGGAGGTIQLLSRSLIGESLIEAKGGSGSEAGGGGGAGGRLFISYASGFRHDAQPQQSHYWRGIFSVEGGKAGGYTSENALYGQSGQNGVVKAEKCFGGYSGPFCQPCPTGTFKYDFSYAACMPCENKPPNSFYTSVGASTSHCPYECSNGLDPVSVNPFCQNALELQVSRVGGIYSSLVVVTSFLILVLFIWIALIAHSNWILRADKDFRSKVYDGVLFNTEAESDASENQIGPSNLKMNDSDIWSHSHRMYLIGENSINFPWFIPKDFPSRALSPENKDKLIRFIKSRQDILMWTGLQKDIYVIFRCICPPLANLIHRCFRRRHFNKLQEEIYQTFGSDFWDSSYPGRTLRVSSSTTDNQMAYIDFMDYEKRKKDYIGPQLPLTLMLGGSGTFNSPYYVNFEDDALAKSIVYFNKNTLKESLPLWFENLNTLLSKTSFFKLEAQVTKDLAEVIDWVEMGNKTLFNPLDTKATIYVFENSYHGVEGGSFKQRRRSFPLESVVFEAFPDLFEDLISFTRTKLIGRKSEIRLGLVLRPYSDEKRKRLLERIRRITQQQKQDLAGLNSRPFEQGSTNLVFGSDDEDEKEEDNYSYARVAVNQSSTQQRSNLGNIVRGAMGESTSDLLEETQMEHSEVYIYGSNEASRKVKIVDKSKRAFDISPDAVKSFELALQKPRTSCKHKMLRCRGFWYAIWVLFFKHHGIPPKAGTRYSYFLGFSIFVALDAIMTAVTCMHMFHPFDNWKSLGIPYFFLAPFASVLGPLCGIIACIVASPKLLKFQASANATAVLVNYPLTLALMAIKRDEPFYIATLIMLWFNKICLSYYGAKVRQHLINPGFCRNASKIEDRFNVFVQAKQELDAGVKSGMSAEERAANLASHGPPSFDVESDDDDQDEDDTSFGIIPKSRLEPVEDERQNLTVF